MIQKRDYKIFTLIERCHTLLADLFPHEGTVSLGGSRIFIGTPLFPTLRKCMEDIQQNLDSWTDCNGLVLLWKRAAGLVSRIEEQGAKGDSEQINSAATLLYLGSGISWNFLADQIAGEIPHDPNYVRVEDFKTLFKRCARTDLDRESIKLDKLIEQISAEMLMCCGDKRR